MMSKKPSLKLVKPTANGNKPCRTLGHHGQNLWDQITSTYDVSDAAGREILTNACEALDRAESLRVTIDRDGEMLQMRNGSYREHPALRFELANRGFVIKALSKLGLDVEPMHPRAGRPAKNARWQPPMEEE